MALQAYGWSDQGMEMCGLVKISDSTVYIANMIYETRLYNRYLLESREQNSRIYVENSRHKNQFIVNGFLNVRLVLKSLWKHFIICMATKMKHFCKMRVEDILCCFCSQLSMEWEIAVWNHGQGIMSGWT